MLRTPPVQVPIPSIFYGDEAHRGDALFLLLPGRGSAGEDFDRNGFISMVKAVNPSIDVIAVDAHFGYYRDAIIVDRLWEDILEPGVEAGYDEIWIMGTSMGGMGAVGLARAHSTAVTGMMLLSPYLGPKEDIKQIRAAGGVRQWSLPDQADISLQLWGWLKGYAEGSERPDIILAFGQKDRLNEGHELLAAILPDDDVVRHEGGHGWRTWKPLWEQILTERFAPGSADR